MGLVGRGRDVWWSIAGGVGYTQRCMTGLFFAGCFRVCRHVGLVVDVNLKEWFRLGITMSL